MKLCLKKTKKEGKREREGEKERDRKRKERKKRKKEKENQRLWSICLPLSGVFVSLLECDLLEAKSGSP